MLRRMGESAWFAGHKGKLLVYRVNRRPLPSGALAPLELPKDAFEHFVDRLVAGYQVKRGRANKRVWQVGGIEVDHDQRQLTGRLGSQPVRRGMVPKWLDDQKDWELQAGETAGEIELLPFGYDGESRLLTVLQHGKAAVTIATVFQTILHDNEKKLREPTTAWSVEPLLDTGTFLSWLRDTAAVQSVSFTARLPNPESLPEFGDLPERIKRIGAIQHEQSFRAPPGGTLQGVDKDPGFQGGIAMGKHGFATLKGDGERADGSHTAYRQAEKVAYEHLDSLPSSWPEMRALLRLLLKDRLRRFLGEGTS
jgi:hypothetical protein